MVGKASSVKLLLLLVVTVLAVTGWWALGNWTRDPPPIDCPDVTSIIAPLSDLQPGVSLILLEPGLLRMCIPPEEWQELRWRFDLDDHWDDSSLTMAVFEEEFEQLDLSAAFYETRRFEGPSSIYGESSRVQHVFYQSSLKEALTMHLVVLHRVEQYFWMGAFPVSREPCYFGLTERIFDPFTRVPLAGTSLTVPDDIGHFLGQIPTSRYLHCPAERNALWLAKYANSENAEKNQVSELGILAMKSLTRELGWQFWIAGCTLLGWHRQCAIIPYTDDTDFGTWSKYLENKDQTEVLLTSAPPHNLRLIKSLGEHSRTQEFTFMVNDTAEKLDLFVYYHSKNQQWLYNALHIRDGQYAYQRYPRFELCSVALLGHKLHAPCDPELIVSTEFSPFWEYPLKHWSYEYSPRNLGPFRNWTKDFGPDLKQETCF